MERSGLNVPTENTFQCSIFCFICIFNIVEERVCKKSFCNLCMMVSECYDFEMDKRHGLETGRIYLFLIKELAQLMQDKYL